MISCPTCSPETYFKGHAGLCTVIRTDGERADLLARIRRTYRRLMKKEPDMSKSIGDLKCEMDTQLAGDGDHGDEADHEDVASPLPKRRRITPTPDKAQKMKAYMMKSMRDMLTKQKDALLKILQTDTQTLIEKTADHVPNEFEDWRVLVVDSMNVNYGRCYADVSETLDEYITNVLPMM